MSDREIGKSFLADNVIESSDQFSDCGTYRYRLSFDFRPERGRKKARLAFVGLNPSSARAWKLDPTVFKVGRLAHRMGFAGYDVFNAFGLVSTDPKGLKLIDDPNGPGNDEALQAIPRSSFILAGWGVHAGLGDRFSKLAELLPSKMYCLGVTKAGFPRHPLYVPESVEPVVYDVPVTP